MENVFETLFDIFLLNLTYFGIFFVLIWSEDNVDRLRSGALKVFIIFLLHSALFLQKGLQLQVRLLRIGSSFLFGFDFFKITHGYSSLITLQFLFKLWVVLLHVEL